MAKKKVQEIRIQSLGKATIKEGWIRIRVRLAGERHQPPGEEAELVMTKFVDAKAARELVHLLIDVLH